MSDRERKPQEAKVTCQSLMAESEHGRLLIADILIDCPACGVERLTIHGHHLKAIRDFLIATIDAYPDLTNRDGDYTAVEHFRMQGSPPADPTSN